MKITRVFDLIDKYNLNNPDKVCLSQRKEDKYINYTCKDYKDYSDSISLYLLENGLKKGDKILALIENSPEWNFLNMGALQAGVIFVSIYTLTTNEQLKYILNQIKPKFVFVQYNHILKNVSSLYKEKDKKPELILFNPTFIKSVYTKYNKDKNPDLYNKLQKIKARVKPEDIITIIYTSGSTGNPKGIAHSHISTCNDVVLKKEYYEAMNPEYKAMITLPLSASFAMGFNYIYQYLGATIIYVDNTKSITEYLQEIKPELLILVPMLIEKIYNDYLTKHPDKKVSFKQFTGNNIKQIYSSGTALPEYLFEFCNKSGVPVYHIYGSTETFSITIKSPDDPKNKLHSCVKSKLAEDGEILIKTPTIMTSYYKIKTDVIDEDGWYHTGDIGILEEGKYIKIHARKGTSFKTVAGKFVKPEIIESALKKSHFVSNVLIYGLNKSYLVALIIPNLINLKKWCSEQNIKYTEKAILNNKEVKKEFDNIITKYNYDSNAADAESIKKYIIITDKWSPETGELTNTFKIKRNFIIDKYSKEIESLYK